MGGGGDIATQYIMTGVQRLITIRCHRAIPCKAYLKIHQQFDIMYGERLEEVPRSDHTYDKNIGNNKRGTMAPA